jgi:hypothetical protein
VRIRTVFAAGIAILILACAPTAALAVANATLLNTSTGATGVKSSTFVLDRTEWAEGYFVCMYNNTHARSDGHQVGMAGELYQQTANGPFYPIVHLYYDAKYKDDSKIMWYNSTASNNAWHSLSLYQNAVGASDYWTFQVDGKTVNDPGGLWWPYPTGNRCETAVEYASGDAASGFPSFLGRHTAVTVRASNGKWLLQTPGNFTNRVFWDNTCNVPGYSVSYLTPYSDWKWAR